MLTSTIVKNPSGMKKDIIPYTFSAVFLCASIVLAGYFFYDYRYPPSKDDLIAKARIEQLAIKAAIQAYDLDPYSVDFIANVQGTLRNETVLLHAPIINDRNCCFYNPTTGEITKNLPPDFIFPEPPEDQ